MNWRIAWGEWKWTGAALGICLGALLVNGMAWRAGYGANAFGLLGCHFLRVCLLVLAWWAVAGTVRVAARIEQPAGARGVTVLDVIGLCLSLGGCCGCYPVWPVILLALTAFLCLALFASRKDGVPLARRIVLRVGASVLLFTLTWYLCAAVPRQAFRGLGERIEAAGAADKLLAWAEEVIAVRKSREKAIPVVDAMVVGLAAAPLGHGPLFAAPALIAGTMGGPPGRLEPYEIPGWVDDLLGPHQGVRGAFVATGDDPSVTLFTGGSGYYFQIWLRPSRVSRGWPPWWLGEFYQWEWRPGIEVGTGGK